MPSLLTSLTTPTRRRPLMRICGVLIATLTGATLTAQSSYTVLDLSKAGAFDIALATQGGQTAGSTAAGPSLVSHAALWSGITYTDLHPALLLGSATSARSAANGVAAGLQVGSGSGPATANRPVALAWRDTAASATILNVPFAAYSVQASATDGVQIVGYAIGFTKDGTATDEGHALLWEASSGVATDLGLRARATGVGGGQQVGYVLKGTPNAALWRGTSRSLVVLHPTGATSSSLLATDGVRQVGSASYEVRVRVEAAKGNKNATFTYAMVWSGTAASAINLHPYPFKHSYATSVAGTRIVGYGADDTKIGTPAYYHALVWDADLQVTDLNAFLPPGFVGSQALSVDAAGFVSGYMMTATGERHAVVWMPNP